MHITKLSTEHAKEIEQAIKDNDGYCCCAIEKSDDTRCMCVDFKRKIEDPLFEGECHCGLFRKELK